MQVQDPRMMAFFSILGEVLDHHPRLKVGCYEKLC